MNQFSNFELIISLKGKEGIYQLIQEIQKPPLNVLLSLPCLTLKLFSSGHFLSLHISRGIHLCISLCGHKWKIRGRGKN